MPINLLPTFAGLEAGRYSRPIELYTFSLGVSTWRYTSGDEDITFDSQVYTAIPIKREQKTINPGERESDKLRITLPASQLPATRFRSVQPALDLDITVTRIQLDEAAASPYDTSPQPEGVPTTAFVIFNGYASSVQFRGREAIIQANPVSQKFTREIPRFKYQNLCNHVLYDDKCTVAKASFQQNGVVNSQISNVYTINGFSGTAFTGGYIENAAGDDYRAILHHDGDQFTVLLPFYESIVGSTVKVYQGCDHTIGTCKDKFNNVENYGGFPYVPEKNPFNQSQFTKT